MDWKRLEQSLSQSLQDESYPVDTEAMWDAIEPHIPKKKSKNRLWLFLFPSIILIAFGAFYLGFSIASDQQPQHQYEMAKRMVSTGDNNRNYKDRSSQLAAATSHSSDGAIDSSSQELEVLSDDIITPYTNHQNSTSIGHQNHAHAQNLVEEKDITNKPLSQKQIISTKVSMSTNTITVDPLKLRTIRSITIDMSMPTMEGRAGLTHLNHLSRSIDPLAIGNIALPDPPINVWRDQVPFKSRRPIRFYTELSGGVSMLTSGLILNDLELRDGYGNRQAAESNLLSYSGFLKFGLVLSSNWSVRSGLVWSNLYKTSQSSLQFTRELILDDVILQELISSNGVQQIRGSTTVIETVTQRVNRINNYEQLLIPISLLYRNQINSIFYHIELGGAISIIQNYVGFIHPMSESEYALSADTNNWFRDGPNQYIISGLGIDYPLSNRLEISASLNYYYHINEINNSNYGIRESLSFFQLQLGLRHHF